MHCNIFLFEMILRSHVPYSLCTWYIDDMSHYYSRVIISSIFPTSYYNNIHQLISEFHVTKFSVKITYNTRSMLYNILITLNIPILVYCHCEYFYIDSF